MRFHVVPLPHTKSNLTYISCAYTQKVVGFCKMMSSLGHEVFHYGAEGSTEVEKVCTNVIVKTNEEHQKWFPNENLNQFYDLDWEGKAEYWKIINQRTADEINKRKQPGDFICIIAGRLHKPIEDMAGAGCLTVEFGIGYDGSYSKYRVFESYTHYHKVIGAQQGFDPDGGNYDVVIPNYFDPNQFDFTDTPDDYFLYIGRLIWRKGLAIAVQVTQKLGKKLYIAGQGCAKVEGNKIYATDGNVYEGDNLFYVGVVDVEKRKYLMSHAIATFVPSLYIEPFGSTHIESFMSGTPVITTDWGVYPFTVQHGVNGYRCRTFDHFIWATQNVHKLDRKAIKERAIANWSLDRVRYMYQEYFQMLSDLFGKGWYTEHPERTQLDWLKMV